MSYIPWWQRMSPPTFTERFDLGGLAGRLGNRPKRVGLRSGTALASYPPFRGTSGSSGALKAWRGAEMKETLPKSWLPEAGALTSSAILASRDRKPKDESKEDIVERVEKVEKDRKEPDQKPPEDPKWKKALKAVETATFETAANRIKNKILNYYKNKVVTKETQAETRQIVNNMLGELRKEYPKLFDKIVTSHVKKDGTISYVFATPKGKIYGDSLEDIAAKRLNYFGETPSGILSTDNVAQILYENKFGEKDIKTIKQRISQKFLEDYGVEYTTGGEYGGKKHYINKEQFENVLPTLLKEYSTDNQKIEVAKQLIMTHDITSMNQLAQAMKELGYLKWGEKTRERFKKIFPDILQTKYRGGEGIPKNLSIKIRRNLIKEFGAPTVERALIDYKEALGYGESTQIMHTRPKKKLTETLYDAHDLMFGSGKENKAYAYGLDRIRTQVQNNLRKIQHNYSKKDWENNMTVDVSPLLIKDFGFPKRMPLQKYTNKLNSMITDLSLATDGKVTGGMLDESTWDFVETKVGVDWSNVPGMGLIKENLQKIDPLFKKLRYEMKEDNKGRQRLVINEETGMPEVKKGVKLSNDEAELLVTFFVNLPEQIRGAPKNQPISIDDMTEILKRITKKRGGLIGTGVDQYIINRGL